MLNSGAYVDSADVKQMLRTIRKIEPDLVKEFRREIKAIAKPVDDQIKRNIPDTAPMRGMSGVIRSETGRYYINEGRLRWDGQGNNPPVGKITKKFAPNKTQISSAIRPSGRSLTTSLAKIVLQSAPVSMSDMAGRVNKSASISRAYTYRKRNGEIVVRRHRVTTQGKQMIRNLQGAASRYGWSALEGRIDAVAREIDQIVDKYIRIANRGS